MERTVILQVGCAANGRMNGIGRRWIVEGHAEQRDLTLICILLGVNKRVSVPHGSALHEGSRRKEVHAGTGEREDQRRCLDRIDSNYVRALSLPRNFTEDRRTHSGDKSCEPFAKDLVAVGHGAPSREMSKQSFQTGFLRLKTLDMPASKVYLINNVSVVARVETSMALLLSKAVMWLEGNIELCSTQ